MRTLFIGPRGPRVYDARKPHRARGREPRSVPRPNAHAIEGGYMMSIQCSACGYVTNDTRDKNCVRCDAPLDIPAEALQPAVLAPPIAAPPPRFEAPPL